MSLRDIPPVNAVRAFDSAARHGGFAAAGRELGVSANAIGAHVRALEEWLGVSLFERKARGVVLTAQGASYAASVRRVFADLAVATNDIKRDHDPNVVTISCLPSFAVRWLIPRIADFGLRYPGFSLRVLADVPRTDFNIGEVDVAIRLGKGRYENLQSHFLFRETHFAVCAPGFRDRHDLARYEDVANVPLLADAVEARIPEQIFWPHWFAAHGVSFDPDKTNISTLSHSHLSLQAAAAGSGIALASSALIGSDLELGTLVRPFPNDDIVGPYSFFLVYPEPHRNSDRIEMVRDWIASVSEEHTEDASDTRTP